MTALTIDPAMPTTVYAAAPGEGRGVYRTRNGGDTWQAVNTGLPTPFFPGSLVIAPGTPTTVYAAGNGLFKSTDGGDTWQAAATGLPETSVSALAVAPSSPTTLYAGMARRGVYKSTDGGGSWSAANPGLPDFGVADLAVDPTAPTTLYAATGIGGIGVYGSTDGGGTWTALNRGVPAFDLLSGPLVLAPSNPPTLYAAGTGGGVFALDRGPLSDMELALTVSQSEYRAGDRFRVDLTVGNAGPSLAVDVFFGVILPPAAGAGAGCPDGVLVFVTTAFTGIETRCASSPAAGFPPLLRDVTMPAPLPSTTVPDFFMAGLPPGLPAGRYTVFIALTTLDALADGRIDPGDALAASASFTVLP